MRADDDSFERLRAAIDDVAIADAVELLAEARAEARARVRSMLSEALAHSMLDRARAELEALRDPRRPQVEGGQCSSRELAWYVFGVVGECDALSTLELVGISRRHPTTTLAEGTLSAVACRVSAEEFDEEPLRAHLADMEWVEGIARTHEGVLDALRKRTTVIPMRMCTIYRTEGGVREMLTRDSRALRKALEYLDGKTEWGVKVFFDPDRVRSAGADAAEPDSTAGATGAAYMERRRHERDHKEEIRNVIDDASVEIDQRLRALAADGLRNPPQRPEASGHPGEMVLNGVYLVEDEARAAFHEEAQALQAMFRSIGVELVQTGPWPPYNFVPSTIGATW